MPTLLRFLAKLWRGLVLIAALLLSLAAAFATANAITESEVTVALAILIYAIDVYICVVVHELGHAFAARLMGWQVHAIAVWRHAYLPATRKFVRLQRSDMEGMRGVVFATPPFESDWNKGRSIFIFGGPAANLLLAAIGLPFVLELLSRPPWASESSAGLLIACLATISLIVGLANMLPFWGSDIRANDGIKLLQLWIGKYNDVKSRHLWWLYGLYIDGVDAALWNARLVREVDTFDGTPQENSLRDLLVLNHYLAMADLSRCRVVTERHLKSDGPKRPMITLHHAFLVALMDSDAKGAAAILDNVPTDLHESASYQRAKATMLSRSGDTAAAREVAKNAFALASERRVTLDQDDQALFSAIEAGRPIPIPVSRAPA